MTDTAPSDRHPNALIDALRALVESGAFEFPLPGHGRTADRLLTLARVAADNLALARLAEAHLDAITILSEADATIHPDALYGVWASDTPAHRLRLERRDGQRRISGSKAFCTGASLIDRALITVHDEEQVFLVDLDLATTRPCVDTTSWITPAFADTHTATVTFAATPVDDDQIVGPPGWYLDRTGFWHGALAPAACWAGGAIGLADHCLRTANNVDDHLAAHLGVLDTSRWTLHTLMTAAGDAVDKDPGNHTRAIRLAYRARTAIERAVTETIDHATRGFGPRLLANDLWAARRIQELQLYVRQHHDTRDHATLGRLTIERADPSSLGTNLRQ